MERPISANFPERHSRWAQRNKKKTMREFQVNSQIAVFQIKDTMLDLGSDVNILPRNTQEDMGRPKLAFSLIQLRMEK